SAISFIEAIKETLFKYSFLDYKDLIYILSIIESFFSNKTCILVYSLRYIIYLGYIIYFRRDSLKAG
ncbi:hypothetical protein LAWI1_G008877, partial [Lachnellula willkommii]